MQTSIKRIGWLLVLLLGLVGLGAVGCATTGENQNSSSRPWNTPTQWETGLPGGLGSPGR